MRVTANEAIKQFMGIVFGDDIVHIIFYIFFLIDMNNNRIIAHTFILSSVTSPCRKYLLFGTNIQKILIYSLCSLSCGMWALILQFFRYRCTNWGEARMYYQREIRRKYLRFMFREGLCFLWVSWSDCCIQMDYTYRWLSEISWYSPSDVRKSLRNRFWSKVDKSIH